MTAAQGCTGLPSRLVPRAWLPGSRCSDAGRRRVEQLPSRCRLPRLHTPPFYSVLETRERGAGILLRLEDRPSSRSKSVGPSRQIRPSSCLTAPQEEERPCRPWESRAPMSSLPTGNSGLCARGSLWTDPVLCHASGDRDRAQTQKPGSFRHLLQEKQVLQNRLPEPRSRFQSQNTLLFRLRREEHLERLAVAAPL